MIAEGLGLSDAQLYDNETNTGLLWDLGRHGDAYLDVLPGRYDCAAISRDLEGEAERWVREPAEDEDQQPAATESTTPESEGESTDDLWDQALAGIAQPWHREAAAKIAGYENVLRVIAENPGWPDHHCRAAAALAAWGGKPVGS